ncbi:uncharacterized protein LOC129762259 [Toxorhynchites rutilus septentrionalis]|uniref:uncharacterized protein LOC129762259 n=1 Tax=Toxorhynchites rutilus septentrionalis TaxID=329112 RepID=UPI002479CC82|nr:uncharacterized protein LOC129762259 [Toxorhynchites rutilus septentrionalis]
MVINETETTLTAKVLSTEAGVLAAAASSALVVTVPSSSSVLCNRQPATASKRTPPSETRTSVWFSYFREVARALDGQPTDKSASKAREK